MVKKEVRNYIIFALIIIFLAFLVAAAAPLTFNLGVYGSTFYLRVNQTPGYIYNVSTNISCSGCTLPLTYSIYEINSSRYGSLSPNFYNWISINSSTGLISINSTNVTHSGRYSLGIQVRDSFSPYNSASTTLIFILSDPPIITYACNNERTNAREGTLFSCSINASDIYELNYLNFSANYSWFNFNTSLNSALDFGTNWNFSSIVNFTPTNTEVGNWSVNITVSDSFGVSNSTLVRLLINNTNDSCNLMSVSNLTAYTTNNYVIYVNATDNDLLIPDKRVYNESLRFYSNTSWVNISSMGYVTGTNLTQARIDVYTGLAPSVGNWSVMVWVNDSNNYSTSSQIFIIQVFNNSAPVWNSNLSNNFSLIERNGFYLNLSANVTDLDNDLLTFSYILSNSFNSFFLNQSTGVINFTPSKTDTGYHFVRINASDGKINSTSGINFTVLNVDESPFIRNITQADLVNMSLMSSNNLTAREGNLSIITFYVEDNDFLVPLTQKAYYNESLNFSLTIVGNNTNLFNLTQIFYNIASNNLSIYQAVFTPSFFDVGFYNIKLNFSDFNNLSYAIYFNMTIVNSTTPLPYPPVVEDVAIPSSGGGGGGSSNKQVVPFALKLVLPGQVASDLSDRLVIPISLVNDGKVNLKGIYLNSSVFMNGLQRSDITSSFEDSYFDSLAIGGFVNTTLIVNVNTKLVGDYEIDVTANVQDPSYKDTGKIILSVKEGKKIEERILFTEQFIDSKPQCAEIKEMVNRAKTYFNQGNFTGSEDELKAAIDACTKAISQKSTPLVKKPLYITIFSYVLIGSIAAVVLGIAFYYYKRIKIARVLSGR